MTGQTWNILQRGWCALLLALAGGLLAGCMAGAAPTATVASSPTPPPTATRVASPIASSTVAPTPVATSTPPLATATPTRAASTQPPMAFPTPVIATRTPENHVVAATWGAPFALGIERSALVAAADLRLTFRRVAEDSRCPVNVDCVWSGQALVVIQVTRGGRDLGELTVTWMAGSKPQALPGGTIQITKIDPSRVTTVPLDPSTYVATLLLEQ